METKKITEEEWLENNIDNIMRNLIQGEDHLRYLKSKYDPKHASCIVKHLYMVEGEAQEAISHASVVKEEWVDIFKEVYDKAVSLRKRIQRGEISPTEAIREVRNIRKIMSSINPVYYEDKCIACRNFHKILRLADNPILFYGSYILVAIATALIILLIL